MKSLLIGVLIILISGCTKKERVNNIMNDIVNKFEKIVIDENEKDKEFAFEIEDSLKISKYSITYLGICQDESIKLAYRGVLSGNKISPHFDSYLLVYSSNGEKLGGYYIGSIEKPKLVNEVLIFEGIGDCNQSTRISFKDSIPTEIFIHCKEENGKIFGDFYNFERQK